MTVRRAGVEDSLVVARLLHEFNTEFETPSPGPDILATRLQTLLASADTFALLAGEPAIGFALVTLRTNVWYDGPVALLDELYVAPNLRSQGIGSALMAELFAVAESRNISLIEINVDEGDIDAQRFYERHGFSGIEATTNERAFYYYLERDSPTVE